MMNETAKKRLSEYAELLNEQLKAYSDIKCDTIKQRNKILAEAMSYSLLNGGKRIRGALVLEFCRICGGDIRAAMTAACGLEMIHAFSLIQDDLPCMDDDDMRRGKPSCHKVYGEAVALLAGDALDNLALAVVAADDKISVEVKIELIKELTDAVGVNGMIGGQVIDMQNVRGADFTAEELTEMNELKTGALMSCACRMGCICAGRSDLKEEAGKFGNYLGIVFQITDDILDIISTDEELGKQTGSDEKQGKTTYAELLGIEKARKAAEEYNDKAKAALGVFEDTGFLRDLADGLLARRK